ncbi:MAG: GNAT family N-acetyltransferase [Oscillospiraceae bacterium]|nr:GNAT family N-acetyltransferase [Oscillospiraceae bacterium]
MLLIREAVLDDVDVLCELYTKHLTATPPEEAPDKAAWTALLGMLIADGDYHLLVGEADGRVVSSVTLIVIRNLTHNLRPYALIENVVTHADYRHKGYASALMGRAGEIAQNAGCYKIMLMTGSKQESTLQFYERCGFSRHEKTAFLKRL